MTRNRAIITMAVAAGRRRDTFAGKKTVTWFSYFRKKNGMPAYASMTVFVEKSAPKRAVTPAQAGVPFDFFYFSWGGKVIPDRLFFALAARKQKTVRNDIVLKGETVLKNRRTHF